MLQVLQAPKQEVGKGVFELLSSFKMVKHGKSYKKAEPLSRVRRQSTQVIFSIFVCQLGL